MQKKTFLLCAIMLLSGCARDTETEKYQRKRNTILYVKENIVPIEIEDIAIGALTRTYLVNNYLIIADYNSYDKLIHILDKQTFKYIQSIGNRGQGPGEITNMGNITADEKSNLLFISDHGKQVIFSYNLDSTIVDPYYMPNVKATLDGTIFPDSYVYYNDTLCFGVIIEPIGNNDFKSTSGKWNMKTGNIELLEYIHPKIEKKRVATAISIDKQIIVEGYSRYDLMTIYNYDGSLKCNIYGPNWTNDRTNIDHYNKLTFCDNFIVSLYSGKDRRSKQRYPTTFIVFDINGNYIKTLETEYQITGFCYDQKENRLIMSLDDDIQFAYLNLNQIIE